MRRTTSERHTISEVKKEQWERQSHHVRGGTREWVSETTRVRETTRARKSEKASERDKA